MRYRDLKDERDAAIARAREAERLSMKSEFERVTAEFEAEKKRLITEADERVRKSYICGFNDGVNSMANVVSEVRRPKPPLDDTQPVRSMVLATYVKNSTCHHVWESDGSGVQCCALCGVITERRLSP